MAMSDWTTGVNTAIEKTQIEIARKLLDKGLSLEFIHETTGVDIETLQSLQ
jgi:predicted transposase YdaD